MALIGLKTRCAICGATLGSFKEATGLHHFINDRNDPFWRFSDAAVHLVCYERWPLRAEWEVKYQRHLKACEDNNRRFLGT
jgi:hypothetical protein